MLVDDRLALRQPLGFMLMRAPNTTITIIGQAATVAERAGALGRRRSTPSDPASADR